MADIKKNRKGISGRQRELLNGSARTLAVDPKLCSFGYEILRLFFA